ncbi:FadR/GntR family transcriptional regulator [Saccharopolyspora sp. NPDC000995]
MSLPEELSERLLAAIIDGTHPPGVALPSECELAEQFPVSRLTVREAIKALRVQNVVRIQRGRGTYVNAPAQWTALDPMIRAATSPESSRVVSGSLIDARRLLEVGAAELAAAKRTEEDLVQLREQLHDMRTAADTDDVELFVAADIAFHNTVMQSTGNVFIPRMFKPFGRLLIEDRRETSAVREIRTNVIEHHAEILRALESGNPARFERRAALAPADEAPGDVTRHREALADLFTELRDQVLAVHGAPRTRDAADVHAELGDPSWVERLAALLLDLALPLAASVGNDVAHALGGAFRVEWARA